MSQCLVKCLPHLIVLANASPKLTRLMIQEAGKDLIKALLEVLKNVWENKVILTPTARKVIRQNNYLEKFMKTKQRKADLMRFGPKLLPMILPSVLSQIYGSYH